jgi:O-antigen/teichoic acid export membrane protein
LGLWRQNAHLHDVAVLAASSVGSQIIVIVATPILTRLYTTADFATFGLFMATTSILGIISCGCYEQAVVACKGSKEAINTLLLSLSVTLITTSLCAATVLAWKGPLNRVMVAPNDSHVVYFLPFAVFAIGYSESIKHWFVRRARFDDAASSRVWQSVVGSIIQVVAGFGRMMAGTGLVAGRVVGILLSGVILQRRLGAEDFKSIRHSAAIGEMLAAAKRHRGFPLYLSGSLVMAQLAYWSPAYLLAIYYGANETGSYALVVRVISVPMQFVGDAFQKVLYQRAADEANRCGAPGASVTRTLASLLGLAAIPSVFLVLFGSFFFRWAFGTPWTLAGEMASCVAPMVFLNLVVCPLYPLFSIQRKQRTLFYLQVAKLVLSFLPVVVAAYMHASAKAAILGYSVGQSAMFALTLVLALRYCRMPLLTTAKGIGQTYLQVIRMREVPLS